VSKNLLEFCNPSVEVVVVTSERKNANIDEEGNL
jgi:hypothetical protein